MTYGIRRSHDQVGQCEGGSGQPKVIASACRSDPHVPVILGRDADEADDGIIDLLACRVIRRDSTYAIILIWP